MRGDVLRRRTSIAARRPDLLRPDYLSKTRRPQGSREFALRDRACVRIVFRHFD